MTCQRAVLPKEGRRYLVIRGRFKGRLIMAKQVAAAAHGTPVIIGWLCDGWGGRTGFEIVVRISDVE